MSQERTLINLFLDSVKKYPENVPTSEEYESGLEQALKAAGLHDWAKKAHDIRVWLEKNFGVEVAPGRKVIIIPSAGTFSAKLAEDAPKWGVSTAAEALKKAGSAIAGAVTGIAMSKAAHIGLTVAGFGLFIPFIANILSDNLVNANKESYESINYDVLENLISGSSKRTRIIKPTSVSQKQGKFLTSIIYFKLE